MIKVRQKITCQRFFKTANRVTESKAIRFEDCKVSLSKLCSPCGILPHFGTSEPISLIDPEWKRRKEMKERKSRGKKKKEESFGITKKEKEKKRQQTLHCRV